MFGSRENSTCNRFYMVAKQRRKRKIKIKIKKDKVKGSKDKDKDVIRSAIRGVLKVLKEAVGKGGGGDVSGGGKTILNEQSFRRVEVFSGDEKGGKNGTSTFWSWSKVAVQRWGIGWRRWQTTKNHGGTVC